MTAQLPSRGTTGDLCVGDKVTYWYGSRKVHATVYAFSLTGKRVRIKYPRTGYNFDEHAYVMAKNLERGHV